MYIERMPVIFQLGIFPRNVNVSNLKGKLSNTVSLIRQSGLSYFEFSTIPDMNDLELIQKEYKHRIQAHGVCWAAAIEDHYDRCESKRSYKLYFNTNQTICGFATTRRYTEHLESSFREFCSLMACFFE